MLDYNQIKELIKEIDSSSLRVFELENNDVKLKLSKNEECNVNSVSMDNSNKVRNATEYLDKVENTINKQVIEEVECEDLTVIKSPLVGTYYGAGSPDADPYVSIGSTVKKGDVLCIVEAMKIMNEITSEVDGEITDVLRCDEDIVEFGMELFKIRSK